MEKRKITFVVNPISGKGDGLRAGKKIELAAAEAGIEATVVYSQSKGHATVLSREASLGGQDVVVAVGGDGTVNEVASALVGTSTAFSIVPRGSGNGLAYHLGMPHDITKALDIIGRGEVHPIDTATFDGHPFFCTAGVGYDALVAMDYAKDRRRGLLTYAEHALSDWKKYEARSYRIDADGKILELKALLVTVGNANQWGNNFHITPGARLDDGMLNITVVHPVTTLQALPLLPRLLHYSLSDDVHVTTIAARKIVITRDGSPEAHYDGEAVNAGGEITLECVPASLKVISRR